MTNEEIKAEINWVRAKSRFINSDLHRLISLHKLIYPNNHVDWSCPSCVRRAIDSLIEYQTKL